MITLKILAVDDESGMLSGIQRALENFRVPIPDLGEEAAFETCTAGTGEAAVDFLKAAPPDIMLLDYKLPGMGGLDVLNEAVAVSPATLTIMITAYASIETAIMATKRGAYDFLPKPFTPADLRHTVRKAAAHVLLARRARALEAERKRVRFEFIRVLGHELKAPINAVAGYLYLLRERTLGESVTGYDDAIRRSLLRLDQMRKLISDLLDMTRIESGEKTRMLERVDLAEAARCALEGVRAEAEARGITLELDAPPPAVLERADRGEIDMVFNNLLTNAVKYNKDGGHVRVAIEARPPGAVISVSDTGIGMTEEAVGRLFQEFVRIKDARTRYVLGSGLGLSILKKIVTLYDGAIDVRSRPDEGTTFIVRLGTSAAGNGMT